MADEPYLTGPEEERLRRLSIDIPNLAPVADQLHQHFLDMAIIFTNQVTPAIKSMMSFTELVEFFAKEEIEQTTVWENEGGSYV